MTKQAKACAVPTVVLAGAGLICVTVLAVLHDIGGQVALVAIVAILGAGGVHTTLSVLGAAAQGAYLTGRRPGPPAGPQGG